MSITEITEVIKKNPWKVIVMGEIGFALGYIVGDLLVRT